MPRPRISVVICTWNRWELLRDTLSSLSAQQAIAADRCEVLVVDNNSSDQTPELVRNFERAWPIGTLRLLREPRQGKQFALNLAIRESRGDVLAFTDDDVLFPPDWLSTALSVFEKPKFDIVGGKTLLVWPDGAPPNWFAPSMQAVVAGVDLGDQPLDYPPEGYAPAGTNLIVRRKVFERIGGFSESHFRHMDYEFGMRALRSGVSVCYRPELFVYTRVPREILNKRYFRRWYFKLGIAGSFEPVSRNVVRLWSIPRWMWHQVLSDLLAVVVRSAALRRGAKTFHRELRALQLLGYIAASFHRRIYPGDHERWVERWSQKKGATFE